jgi:hypothetical protein
LIGKQIVEDGRLFGYNETRVSELNSVFVDKGIVRLGIRNPKSYDLDGRKIESKSPVSKDLEILCKIEFFEFDTDGNLTIEQLGLTIQKN